MRLRTRTATRLGLALVVLLTAVPHAAAAPPTLASDEALVAFYRSRSATYDHVDCNLRGESSGCDVTLTTVTTPYPCTAEVIEVAGVPLPAKDTFCNASLVGRLEGGTVNGRCDLSSLNVLHVTFNSGVNSLFSGSFENVGALFVPQQSKSAWAGRGTLKVDGVGQLGGTSIGTGEIHAAFRLVFTTPLAPDCRSGMGYLVPLHDSEITIRN